VRTLSRAIFHFGRVTLAADPATPELMPGQLSTLILGKQGADSTFLQAMPVAVTFAETREPKPLLL